MYSLHRDVRETLVFKGVFFRLLLAWLQMKWRLAVFSWVKKIRVLATTIIH